MASPLCSYYSNGGLIDYVAVPEYVVQLRSGQREARSVKAMYVCMVLVMASN